MQQVLIELIPGRGLKADWPPDLTNKCLKGPFQVRCYLIKRELSRFTQQAFLNIISTLHILQTAILHFHFHAPTATKAVPPFFVNVVQAACPGLTCTLAHSSERLAESEVLRGL